MAAAEDWRCTVPARWLPGTKRWLADFQQYPWPEALERMVDAQQGETAIFVTPGDEPELGLITALRARGVRVLVETDEPVLRYNQPFLIGQANRPGHESIAPDLQARMRDLHRRCVDASDGLIVSTYEVASSYAETGKPTFVCPSSVDPADWPVADKPRDGILRIGFAGSELFRIADLELVHPALSWAAEQEGVEVVLMGADPTSQPTPEEDIELHELDHVYRRTRSRPVYERQAAMLEAIRERQAKWRFPHRFIPTAPLADYRRTLAQLDVGLCVVDEQAHEWGKCGSDTKALDYAMAGVLPVCLDATPYWAWADHPLPLAGDSSGLLDLVRQVVESRTDVPGLAAAARGYVLGRRTIEQNIGAWRRSCAPARS